MAHSASRVPSATRAEELINYTFAGSVDTLAKPDFEDSFARVWNIPPTPLEKPVMVLGQGWATSETISGNRRQRWIDSEAPYARVMIVASQATPLKPSYNLDIEAVSPDKPRHLQILLNGAVISVHSLGATKANSKSQ